MVQLSTPDELRGRISAIHLLVVISGPRAGDIESAAVASVIGTQLSVLTGGLACLAGVLAVAIRNDSDGTAPAATTTPATTLAATPATTPSPQPSGPWNSWILTDW